MAERNGRKKKRVNVVRLVLALIVVVLVGVGAVSVKTIIGLHLEKSELEKENAMLEQEKSDLQAELKSIDDLEYIEEQARKQLRMIKPGEVLFVLDEKRSEEVEQEEQEIV